MPGFQQLPNVWMPAWPALARWILLWVEFSALGLQKTNLGISSDTKGLKKRHLHVSGA
jgi:hypothetical protein